MLLINSVSSRYRSFLIIIILLIVSWSRVCIIESQQYTLCIGLSNTCFKTMQLLVPCRDGRSYLLTHEAIMVSDVTECLLTLYVVDLDSLLVSTAKRFSMQGKSAISHSARSHLFCTQRF